MHLSCITGHKTHSKLLALIFVLFLLAACTTANPPSATPATNPSAQSSSAVSTPTALPGASQAASMTTPAPSQTPQKGTASPARVQTVTQTQSASLTPRTPPDPSAWKFYPVVPTLSDTAIQIYQHGVLMGRDPHAFSKVGDCQVSTERFLEGFDQPGAYRLGDYSQLQEVIDWYKGSFRRRSLAARDAMTAQALFSYTFADPQLCQAGEGPLACEYRVHNPSIAIISLEQTWSPNVDIEKYREYMRKAIEYTISQGIVPILATKADNLEGNDQLNTILSQLAWEYDIPLWNFWLAVQPLPNHGLMEKTSSGQPDFFHLTAGNNYYFDVPEADRTGWTLRNLTALQTIDSIWHGLNEIPQP